MNLYYNQLLTTASTLQFINVKKWTYIFALFTFQHSTIEYFWIFCTYF